MTIDETCVCIDNDFLNHVIETDISTDVIESLLSKAFAAISLTAIVHPLVYAYEVIKDDERIKGIFFKGIVSLPTMEDVIGENDERKEYYCYLFKELYSAVFGQVVPIDDITKDWKGKCNLGEVHSLTLCVCNRCVMFLSDDGDSKKLGNAIKEKSLGSVKVYNRGEFFSEPKVIGITNRDTRRKICHTKC